MLVVVFVLGPVVLSVIVLSLVFLSLILSLPCHLSLDVICLSCRVYQSLCLLFLSLSSLALCLHVCLPPLLQLLLFRFSLLRMSVLFSSAHCMSLRRWLIFVFTIAAVVDAVAAT